MKKKIFKYFACMITVAILATTLLLSWVNYEMFKGRVMDDLEAYGRMFAVEMNGEAETQSALHSLEEDIRVTLVHADGTVYYDNFADPNAMDNHADRPEIRQALEKRKRKRYPQFQHRRSKRVLLRSAAEKRRRDAAGAGGIQYMERVFPLHAAHHAAGGGYGLRQPVSGAPADGAAGAAD